ncbi:MULTISPECIES: hypothetical protein [Bacillus cereus group]|uniref:hypothetical protein n=1 Tax=Bacillus cereus group TaxID=86661 RepID=UPI000BF5CF23|nr:MULTISPECIES: hypothetical protein [Bacillus cereus group]PGA25396.1 hypothetical protein COL80_16085 [Bacillus thuringiensis]PGU82184.1 hypothetical protein COD76_11910 [Bacillus cereus]
MTTELKASFGAIERIGVDKVLNHYELGIENRAEAKFIFNQVKLLMEDIEALRKTEKELTQKLNEAGKYVKPLEDNEKTGSTFDFIALVGKYKEKKEKPKKIYPSRMFETNSELLIGNLKLVSTIPNIMLYKMALIIISNKVRNDLGINNVIGFELSKGETLVKIYVYDVEAEADKAYIQKFDEEVNQFYIELN